MLGKFARLSLMFLFLALSQVTTAQTVIPLPNKIAYLQGSVYTSVTQPDGKVIVGGLFSTINGVPRNNIARLNADGTIDAAWDVDCDFPVLAMALNQGTLYIGGQFNTVNGISHRALAAVDTATGAALDFDAQLGPNDYIEALTASPTTLFVAGRFTSIVGATRDGLAGIALSTWTATAWEPHLQRYLAPWGDVGWVASMAVYGQSVYVGGYFLAIGGKPISNLARVDATAGLADDWNAAINDDVAAIVLTDNSIYIGGAFHLVGGQVRNGIAEIDPTSAQATAWNPDASSSVYSLLVSGDTIYVGGFFGAVGGQTRRKIAALNRATGSATSWNANIGDGPYQVNTLASSGTGVVVGGNFVAVQNHNVGGLARFERADATAYSTETAGVRAQVSAIATQPNGKVVLAGDFSQIDGVDRNHIARLNADGSLDLTWNPNSDGRIVALAAADNTLYAGGGFQHIGGKARSNLAAIDLTSGAVAAWNPAPDAGITSLTVLNGYLYVAGWFANIGGQPRATLAAFDATTFALSAWNPGTNNYPMAISGLGNTIYVGGEFTQVGGSDRKNIAAIDATTGETTSWNPTVDTNPPGNFSFVWTLLPLGNTIYAGGSFASVGGEPHYNVAGIDATTGFADEWDAAATGQVYALAADDNYLYVGGSFWTLGYQDHQHIGVFSLEDGQIVGWNQAPWPGNFDYVDAIGTAPGKVWVGGYFTHAANVAREALIGLEAADLLFHSNFE